jgi:hypothetical protein
MVELFASIGATGFHVTFTHLTGEPRGFRKGQTVAQVCTSLPYLMRSHVEREINIIVRPIVPTAAVIQLDDIDAANAAKIAPAAFLTLETSPGNFQAWVAVKDAPRGLIARIRRGVGADLNASGATRVAGTHNFKAKYAPHFPTVRIAADQLGHIAQVAELEAMGVLAPEQTFQPAPAQPTGRPARSWPDYQRCIDGAPIGASGKPSRTAADFVWCKIAASWRHPVDAIARELLRVSTKAQENGEAYARQTAENAAWAAQHRGPKP